MKAVNVFDPVLTMRKELPQRSRRGALTDISNQAVVSIQPQKSEVTNKLQRVSKAAAENAPSTIFASVESQKRKMENSGFTIWQDNETNGPSADVKLKAETCNTRKSSRRSSKSLGSEGIIPEAGVLNCGVDAESHKRRKSALSGGLSKHSDIVSSNGCADENVVNGKQPKRRKIDKSGEATIATIAPTHNADKIQLPRLEDTAVNPTVCDAVHAGKVSRRRKSSDRTANVAAVAATIDSTIVDAAATLAIGLAATNSLQLVSVEATDAVHEKRVMRPKNRDIINCSDILDQMYVHFNDVQRLFAPKPYLERQSDINSKMRAILVDWLLEVHYKFKFQGAALWLCINILDRFLEHVPTARSDLQLVGIASLLIACKFEEIYPPEIRDCVYITDYAYTKDQVLKMEAKILRQLDYQIFVPTGYHFMIRYLNLVNASDQIRHLSFYYAERNLQEYDMLNCSPSQFSAAALFAALAYRADGSPVIASSIWSLELVEITGYSEAEVIPIALNLLKHVHEESYTASKRQLLAAKKKYSSEKYLSVSGLGLPAITLHEST